MLAVVALVATACGGGGTDPDSTADEAQASTVEAGDAADGIDRNATLVFQSALSLDTMDPDANTSGYTAALLFPYYDRLIHIDPGTATFIPGLAESWEFRNDGTVLRLNLREGVVFHDGEPFNAAAVEANFERSRNHEIGRDETTKAVRAIGNTVIIDDFTIDLRKAEGQDVGWSIIEANLAMPLGMMISPAVIQAGIEIDRNPVGTGAWKLVAIQADRTVSERFDGYWNPDAALVQRLELVHPSGPDTHLNALVSGQTNITEIEPNQVRQVEAQSNIKLEVVSTLRVDKMAINHSMPPFDDINVRRALLYGIDRNAVQQLITDDTASPTPQFFPPGYFAYNDEFGEDAYPYNPERARELLESSTYWNGEEILPRPGLVVYTSPAYRIRLAEIIQDQMSRVGLNIEFTPFEQAQKNPMTAGEAPYSIMIHARSRLEPLQHLVQSLDTEFGVTNPGGFTTQEIDNLLVEAARLPSGERAAIVRRISGLQTDGVYGGLGLYAAKGFYAQRCVTGWTSPIATFFDFQGVGVLADCA